MYNKRIITTFLAFLFLGGGVASAQVPDIPVPFEIEQDSESQVKIEKAIRRIVHKSEVAGWRIYNPELQGYDFLQGKNVLFIQVASVKGETTSFTPKQDIISGLEVTNDPHNPSILGELHSLQGKLHGNIEVDSIYHIVADTPLIMISVEDLAPIAPGIERKYSNYQESLVIPNSPTTQFQLQNIVDEFIRQKNSIGWELVDEEQIRATDLLDTHVAFIHFSDSATDKKVDLVHSMNVLRVGIGGYNGKFDFLQGHEEESRVFHNALRQLPNGNKLLFVSPEDLDAIEAGKSLENYYSLPRDEPEDDERAVLLIDLRGGLDHGAQAERDIFSRSIFQRLGNLKRLHPAQIHILAGSDEDINKLSQWRAEIINSVFAEETAEDNYFIQIHRNQPDRLGWALRKLNEVAYEGKLRGAGKLVVISRTDFGFDVLAKGSTEFKTLGHNLSEITLIRLGYRIMNGLKETPQGERLNTHGLGRFSVEMLFEYFTSIEDKNSLDGVERYYFSPEGLEKETHTAEAAPAPKNLIDSPGLAEILDVLWGTEKEHFDRTDVAEVIFKAAKNRDFSQADDIVEFLISLEDESGKMDLVNREAMWNGAQLMLQNPSLMGPNPDVTKDKAAIFSQFKMEVAQGKPIYGNENPQIRDISRQMRRLRSRSR